MKRLIACLVLLLSVGAFAQTAYSPEKETTYVYEARAALRQLLGDIDATAANRRWADSTLNEFIGLSMRGLASMGSNVKLDTIVTTGTFVYTLSTDCISPVGVLVKGTDGRWKSLTYRSLDSLSANFGRNSATGSLISSYYVVDKSILIDPAGNGDDSLIVVYKAMANEVTGDTVIVDLAYPYQDILLQDAMKRALLSRGELK
jgi:hypothetical protein